MEWMCSRFFTNPNYLRFGGRPVIGIYLARVLWREGYLTDVIGLMRQGAAKFGFEIYIIGDIVFGPSGNVPRDYAPFELLDAVTMYDVYGSFERGYAYKDGLSRFYDNSELWRSQAQNGGCAFVAAASPGYNDRSVRPEDNNLPLSRRLSPSEPHGSLYAQSLKRALRQVDRSAANLLLINSFNGKPVL